MTIEEMFYVGEVVLYRAIVQVPAFECSCCGSRDLAHDAEACKQAAYVEFDAWRSGLVAANLWEGDEYSRHAGIKSQMPADICPAMGLY